MFAGNNSNSSLFRVLISKVVIEIWFSIVNTLSSDLKLFSNEIAEFAENSTKLLSTLYNCFAISIESSSVDRNAYLSFTKSMVLL